jgi:cytochrome P450
MTATHLATGPLPRAWPLVGHFPAYGRDPLGFVTRLAQEPGGVTPVRMGPLPALMVTDAAAIEEILVTRQRDFRKSPATRRVGVVIGDGLLISEGNTWREHRRAVQPAFHRQRVAAWGDAMVGEAEATIDGWPEGGVVDIHQEMTALTLRIVVRTLLGSDVERDDVDEVGVAAAVLTDHFESRFNSLRYFIPDALPTPGNLRMRRAVRRLDRIIFRLISAGRARAARAGDADTRRREDVISMLLDETAGGDRPLTDREVRDEAMTLFLAGHETTALALAWSIQLLARHPEVESATRAEVDRIVGSRAATVEELPRLLRVEAVILEALRLYPPAYAISREAVRSTTIAGRRLPKRGVAFVSVYAAHRNPERFPEPDAFRPERWLDGLARRLPKGAYLPFAEGPRKCIGASFAMQEAALVLATILARTRLQPLHDREVGVRPAVTLRPASPIRMRVEKREGAL